MKILGRQLLVAIVTLCAVHILTYAILRELPAASVAFLGIYSANPDLVKEFDTQRPSETYGSILTELIRGDLGRTLDGTSVSSELVHSILQSTPHAFLAGLLVVALCLVVAFHAQTFDSSVRSFLEAVAFFPPFVGPSLALLLTYSLSTLQLGYARSAFVDWMAITLGIALPVGAVAAAQVYRITVRNLQEPFTIAHRAIGVSELSIRSRLLRNLLIEMVPSMERLSITFVSSLLFAEVLFGQPGFGTLAVRAIRRADLHLILGVVLTIAFVVVFLRMTSHAVQTITPWTRR